jgi:glycosyltransferase involved in cell wall biosynthesis
MISATPQTVHGGSGTYVASAALSRGLRALGHDVRLIHPQHSPRWLGYTVHRFRFNRGLHPGVVQDSDMTVGWDMDGYTLAGRLTRPFVAYIHGQLADEARFERGAVAASMRLQAWAERRSAHRADLVLTVSGYSRRRIAATYGLSFDHIRVVPPAFEATRWNETLRTVGHDGNRAGPTVLSVAHMYPRKNLASLLRATVAVRRALPQLKVVLVGDGPERRRLEQLAQSLGLGNSVQFTGPLPYERLVETYAATDLFCLPSLQEGFGLVFLEAMATAKPVVACRGTAAEELIDDGVNGLLVPPGDEAALTQALRSLLVDPDTMRRMGSNGPPRVTAFEPVEVARRFLETVREL